MVFQSHISTLTKQHSFKSLVAASLCLIVFGCSRNESLSAEYQEACHGEPLTTVAQRNQALEDGFVINQQFKCIDKASYLAMQEAEARDAQIARQREQRGYESEADPTPKYELRYVEINSASVAELTHVCNIKNGTAEDIVKERERNGQFGDWVDVVHRVFAMSAAQNVVYASVCGLTVNGQSFNGAPADEAVAQQIYQRYSHYK